MPKTLSFTKRQTPDFTVWNTYLGTFVGEIKEHSEKTYRAVVSLTADNDVESVETIYISKETDMNTLRNTYEPLKELSNEEILAELKDATIEFQCRPNRNATSDRYRYQFNIKGLDASYTDTQEASDTDEPAF